MYVLLLQPIFALYLAKMSSSGFPSVEDNRKAEESKNILENVDCRTAKFPVHFVDLMKLRAEKNFRGGCH